jgi:poly(A) polymerase
MPVITPAYPSMCATHNFTRATQTVLHNEFSRGGQITDQIMLGKVPWKDLFVKHTFFTAGYKYYLAVISASTTKDAQLSWSGTVESKIRLLVAKLLDHPSIQLARPFNKGFNRVHRCRTDAEIDAVKGGSLDYYAKDVGTATSGHGLAAGAIVADNSKVDESKVAEDDSVTMVYTTTNYIGLELYEGKFVCDCLDHLSEPHYYTMIEKILALSPDSLFNLCVPPIC